MRRWIALIVLGSVLQGCARMNRLDTPAASERRSTVAVQDDRNIEHTALQRVAEKYRQDVQLSVTSFNHFVLLTGQVPDESSKVGIERIVAGIDRVKGVANELHVAQGIQSGIRYSDSGISGDVRARMLANKGFQLDHIKVYTEEGVVYLFGIVKRAEADAASEIASTTYGVKKVVRVFEYLD
ncbi:MAG: BON domain-containing protein [Sideroxyarcus sp.]|nr:BON domain-containing protein [Sideroxyarcus sp.]